jgi:hypothetical protein
MNRYFQSLILLVVLAFSFSACDSGNGSNGDADSLAVDTSAMLDDFDPYKHAAGTECATLKPYDICYQGFDFIKLRDTLAWKDLKVPGGMVKDTVFNEIQFGMGDPDTISWVVRMIDEGGQRVYLESDFESNWFLNRVRIENPKYTLQPFGVRVGMTIAELKTKFPKLYINSLPDYKMVEVYPSSNVFFLFEETGFVPKDALPTLSMVPEGAKIKSIVLM